MKKVVHYYPQYNLGGTEIVIKNIVSNIDLTKYSFTFLSKLEGTMDTILKEIGGKIKHIDSPNNFKKELYEYLKKERFEIIHVHTCKEMGDVLKIAKKAGIKIRIAHSHNARNDLPKIARMYKIIKSYNIEKYANVLLGCSEAANRWLFPRKYKQAIVFNNPIDIQRYKYSTESRLKIRKEMKIDDDTLLFITVGRLSKEKNHQFIIGLVNKYLNNSKKYKFIFIGDGPEKENISETLNILNINNIELLGIKNNIEEYLSASDIFLLPSLAEGLPLVLVEAQANGIPCLVSTGVPNEANLNVGLFKSINLEHEEWYAQIINRQNVRKDCLDALEDSKYNIQKTIKIITEIYEG